MFNLAIPVLHVSSSVAAEEFYCGKLGFGREFGLVRDRARLHVSSFPGDGVAGSFIYLLVDDVDLLHEELLQKGVVIDMRPTDQTWGNREIYVRDRDRNKIAFVRPNA